jgi:hypothetical protein
MMWWCVAFVLIQAVESRMAELISTAIPSPSPTIFLQNLMDTRNTVDAVHQTRKKSTSSAPKRSVCPSPSQMKWPYSTLKRTERSAGSSMRFSILVQHKTQCTEVREVQKLVLESESDCF